MEDFLNEENAQETQQDNNFDDDFDFDGENTQQQPENEEEEFEGDNNEQQFDQQEEQAEEEQGVVDQTNDDDQHDQFQQQDSYEPAYNYEEPAQTSKTTPIQEWRQQKNKLIEELDETSRSKKKQIRQTAEQFIEQYLAEREEKKRNQHKKNLEDEEIFAQTNQVASDNVWENVLKYVDIHGASKKQAASNEESLDDLDKVDLSFKKKGSKGQPEDLEIDISVRQAENKDVSRMRKILLTLKNQPLPTQPTA